MPGPSHIAPQITRTISPIPMAMDSFESPPGPYKNTAQIPMTINESMCQHKVPSPVAMDSSESPPGPTQPPVPHDIESLLDRIRELEGERDLWKGRYEAAAEELNLCRSLGATQDLGPPVRASARRLTYSEIAPRSKRRYKANLANDHPFAGLVDTVVSATRKDPTLGDFGRVVKQCIYSPNHPKNLGFNQSEEGQVAFSSSEALLCKSKTTHLG